MTSTINTEVVSNDIQPGTSFPPLTNADRSDAYASGAVQALVRVAKAGQDLLFDKHAFDKHEATLIGQGWEVIEDVREAVLNPPKTAYDTSDH
jgi:hypothetical protein